MKDAGMTTSFRVSRHLRCCWLLVVLSLVVSTSALADDVVMTGKAEPQLASIDQLMTGFLTEHKLPGAAVAVSRNGKIAFARGYGFADVENQAAVQPDSLFRIASISKPITAVAVLQLVEQKKLDLDASAFEVLKWEPHREPDRELDARLMKVTIRQLLQHTGGWDRDKSYDAMFRAVPIARALGVAPPAKPEHVVRFMLGQPLDFEPGERYAYSNFGYCVLGRLIEHASGQSYECYVQEHVLRPLGICAMTIGRTRREGRWPNEVTYYPHEKTTGISVFAEDLGQPVPPPYGAWHLEAMDSHGAWVASAIDLVKFAAAFDDLATCKLLKPSTIETMLARPSGAAGLDKDGKPKDAYYGCGWLVRPIANQLRPNMWHNGSLPGTSTILVHRFDGVTWAALFNSRGESPVAPSGLIDPLMQKTLNDVKQWP